MGACVSSFLLKDFLDLLNSLVFLQLSALFTKDVSVLDDGTVSVVVKIHLSSLPEGLYTKHEGNHKESNENQSH